MPDERRDDVSKSIEEMSPSVAGAVSVKPSDGKASSTVEERLLQQGREALKRKNELLRQKEEADAASMKRSVPTSKGTDRIISQNESLGYQY